MIKLLELFITFFLIGLFTIGGGYAMIPMIQDRVLANGWLTTDELLNFFAISESTPGPFAVNTATLIGFSQYSEFPVLGAITTTTAVILPSFIIILLIAKHFHHLMENKVIRWALMGIKATVIGLIIGVVVMLVRANVYVEGQWDIYAIIIIAIVFACTKIFKKIGPIPIIVLSGLLGYLFYILI
ncbi:MAG: chromate transporter [Bacilli bacterium]|jgi:chromate transporter|nr:chromate transporter [Bacilli bacterium]